MSPRLRIILLIIGLSVIFFSLAALAYAIAPGIDLHDQATLAPTLFSPP